MNETTTTEEPRLSRSAFNDLALSATSQSPGMSLAISNFAEAEKFANLMAVSNFVPKHLRGKPADCLAVLLQAKRWGDMDPFAVAQKTYFVNDGIGYEAQLVNAIICSRAPIKGRPDLKWTGEGENLQCTVSAIFIGEDTPKVFTAKLKTITTRNSRLWKQQPDQQLGYFAIRAWARLYCPDVIMGIYTREERHEMIDVTPTEGQSAASTIENELREEVAASKPKEEAHDPVTGEVTDQPTLQEFLHEIADAPTPEGVDFKTASAINAYGSDPTAEAQIRLAKKERKAALSKPPIPSSGNQAQPDSSAEGNGGAKGFFKRVSEKAAKTDGAQ